MFRFWIVFSKIHIQNMKENNVDRFCTIYICKKLHLTNRTVMELTLNNIRNLMA